MKGRKQKIPDIGNAKHIPYFLCLNNPNTSSIDKKSIPWYITLLFFNNGNYPTNPGEEKMDRKLKEEFIESYRKLTGVTVESAEKIYMEYKNKIEFMLFTLWSMDEISKRILKVKFVLFANVYYIYNKGVKWEEEAMAKFSDNCVAIHQKMGMGIPIQRIVRDIRCLY